MDPGDEAALEPQADEHEDGGDERRRVGLDGAQGSRGGYRGEELERHGFFSGLGLLWLCFGDLCFVVVGGVERRRGRGRRRSGIAKGSDNRSE